MDVTCCVNQTQPMRKITPDVGIFQHRDQIERFNYKNSLCYQDKIVTIHVNPRPGVGLNGLNLVSFVSIHPDYFKTVVSVQGARVTFVEYVQT